MKWMRFGCFGGFGWGLDLFAEREAGNVKSGILKRGEQEEGVEDFLFPLNFTKCDKVKLKIKYIYFVTYFISNLLKSRSGVYLYFTTHKQIQHQISTVIVLYFVLGVKGFELTKR